MGRIFEGLVVFLIGVSNLLVVDALGHAETAELVQLDSTHWSIVGINAPLGNLAIFGLILVFAGAIWMADGIIKKVYKIK